VRGLEGGEGVGGKVWYKLCAQWVHEESKFYRVFKTSLRAPHGPGTKSFIVLQGLKVLAHQIEFDKVIWLDRASTRR
jgi:hypothetical protein